MKRIRCLLWVGSLVLYICLPYGAVSANSASGLLICGLQTTGSGQEAGQEFIKLCNTASSLVSLTGYEIEYHTASKQPLAAPTSRIKLSGSILPNGYYLLGTAAYTAQPVMQLFGATLAKDGGHVRLISRTNDQLIVHDTLGWGTALSPETTAASAPGAGEWLERKNTNDGRLVDSNNNAADFVIKSAAMNRTATENNPNTTAATAVVLRENPGISSIMITELLPNPDAPSTDALDEFIELYNPSAVPVDLAGMKLRVGLSKLSSYEIKELTIPSKGYAYVRSETSHLALANSGSRALLATSSGEVIYETEPYAIAPAGQSWAWSDSGWQWTSEPTPGKSNIISSPELVMPKTTSRADTPTKVQADKPAKVKAATTKTVEKKSSTNAAVVSKESSSDTTPTSLHSSVIAGVALVAVVYAGYEYRQDIAHWVQKLRANRAARRLRRQKA